MSNATQVVAVKVGENRYEIRRSFEGRTAPWLDGTWFVTANEVGAALDNARTFLRVAGVSRA